MTQHDHAISDPCHATCPRWGYVRERVPAPEPEPLTPREEFEAQFGPITAAQWQWLKEFCLRHPVTGGPTLDRMPRYEGKGRY